jgi:hypothetical protein
VPGLDLGLKRQPALLVRVYNALASREDLMDLRGLFDRQRPEQHGVDGTDGGGVRENADGQREHGGQREAGGSHEHPRAVREILPDAAERPEAAPLAMGFDRLRDTAESRERRTPCLEGRHPLPDVVLDGLGEMGLYFGLQLAIGARAAKETAKAREKDSQGGHDRSS